MHCLFLNQYFPPDPAPTGVLLAEVAAELRQAGHTVEYISAAEPYRGAQGRAGRWRRELAGHWQMLWRGWRARKPAVVFSASSPPCLLVVATLIALRHRAKSIHWAMDLYPELALALGEIRSGLPSKLLTALMGWSYRRCRRVIALDRDMAAHLTRYGVTAEVVRPWVFAPMIRWVEETVPRELRQEGRPWVWIYSGNLGRAHEWETLLEAQRILEPADARITLIFQGGGPQRAAAQARAAELGLQRCHWRDYAEPEAVVETLLGAQACVVTQLPVTRGLLWPSKLSLLYSLPRPLIFVGDVNGAIAEEVRARPSCAAFAPGAARELAAHLLAFKQSAAPSPPVANPADERSKSLRSLRQIIEAA